MRIIFKSDDRYLIKELSNQWQLFIFFKEVVVLKIIKCTSKLYSSIVDNTHYKKRFELASEVTQYI